MSDQTPPPFEQQVTFIYCSDLEAAWRFYREILGLTPGRHPIEVQRFLDPAWPEVGAGG